MAYNSPVKNSSAKTRAVLNDRSEYEWFAMLYEIIDSPARTQAARIIWWDFCNHRKVVPGPRPFDQYLNDFSDARPNPEHVAEILLKLGYHSSIAFLRASKKDVELDKDVEIKGTHRYDGFEGF